MAEASNARGLTHAPHPAPRRARPASRRSSGPDARVRPRPSLLVYLLLHRDAPQPRQRLAFRLWPDSTEPQALTNLRKVLHGLRRALPDADRFLDVTPRTLQWRAGVPYWLDVAAFEAAAARAYQAEGALAYGPVVA